MYKQKLDEVKNEYIKQHTEYEIIYLWGTDIKNKNYIKVLKEWNL